MKVLVTGATGFVGRSVCRQLLADGREVVALSRGRHGKAPAGVTHVTGDVTDGTGLPEALSGVDAIIHLVGIIRERRGMTFREVHVEGTRNVLLAAEAAGVTRFVQMSALGAGSGSGSAYHESKAEAEQLVRKSGLGWTILRPSLIFGKGDDFFGGTLRQLVTLPPVVPVVGSGSYLFRPVAVEDVALAAARAPRLPETIGREFALTGPDECSLRELLLLVRETLGLRKPLLNVPLPLMRLGVALFRVLPNPPVTKDEFLMLLAGNTADPAPAGEAFGLQPTRLRERLPGILAAAR